MELQLPRRWLLLATIVSCQILHSHSGVTYKYPDEIPQGSASLAFVFDITGSMYDDLVQVIEGAAKILATTLARREKPLYNYVLVPFHDPEIGPVTVTTDPAKFQRDLRDLYVQGGGDCPEMSIGAIKMSLEESLPNSFIYVFTDARAKDYYLTENVLTLIQQKQSQVVFVMTGDCGNTSHPGYKAYEQVASTSSGQVFLLKKKQVNQVLNFVRVAVQSRKVNLLSVDIDAADSIVYKVPIDTKLAEFTVSLSGLRPRVHLRDPEGRRLSKRGGYRELLSLKKALIINVKDPKPGIYTLRVTSDGPHTMRVTGLSSLDFVYGFSRKATLDLRQTENRPMKGIPTYMLLNATQLEFPGRLNMLQLLSLQGKPLLEIPLVYEGSRPTLYNVSAFIPPDKFFYPRVMGIDKKGYEFVRSTPTAISPIAPDIPIITMDTVTKGFYDKTSVLVCQVHSLVPFKVQWYREDEPMGNKLFFTESTDVTYSIPDASSFSEGYYRCNASNAAGWAIAQTYLDVKDPPPAILTPQNVSVLPGNSIILTCVAYSTVEFNLTWARASDNYNLADLDRATVFTNGSVRIRDVKKTDEGEYICKAGNEGGFTEEKLFLLVQKAPKVTILPQEQSFVKGQTVNMTCTSVAYPAPAYVWERNGDVLAITKNVWYDSKGNFMIKDARSKHAGEYTCVATNLAGMGRGTAVLNYNVAPVITVPNQRILVNSGDTATLVCHADGIPKPKITWYHGDTEYSDLSFIQVTDEGDLLILGAQDMDAGDYRCVAKNDAGTSSATIELQVGSAPVITKAPSSRGVEILSNTSLACAADGLPPPEVTWKRADGKALNFQSRFSVKADGSLVIQGIHKEDEGMYTCTVKNQFGSSDVSAFITVTGVVRPLLAYTNPLVETIVGRDVRLSCHVLLGNPRPTITWIKMGERVRSGDGVEDDGNGNLLIKNVQVLNEGEYTCVASNVGGNATYVTMLDVQVPPSIEDDGSRDFTVIQDHSARLPCEVSGDPRPQITWTKNGVRISETDPHYFISEDGSLEIFSADPQDTATYSCTAINVAGVKEKRMTLFVQIPPQISRDQHEYIVIVNNPVQLPCEVQGIPPPTISWRKGKVHISDGNKKPSMTLLPNGALRFSSVQVEDGGMYECVASSVAGNDTKGITLIVQVPPQITSEDATDMVVIAGESVTLGCETDGDPRPVIRWRKDMREISFFDLNHKYMLKESGSLLIEEASVDDTARFLCIAENPAGVVTREINLIVHDPPTIPDDTPRNASIIENQRVTLSCPASGTPPPLITWYKDGQELTGNELGVRYLTDGSLQLDTVQAQDAGEYECVATNVAGTSSHVVDLKVFLPPRFVDPDYGSGETYPVLPENPAIVQNNTIRLMCMVDAIPPPQITWFKDGREIKDADLGVRLKITRRGQELIIKAADVDDTARYTCVARNLAGETEKSYDVEIHVPPRMDHKTVSDRNLSVIVTRPVAIDCPVLGVPPPEIVWFKDGYELYPESDPNLRILSDGRRLEISSSEIGDTGDYKCHAKNPAGELEREFTLNVWVPAKIDGSGEVSSPEVIINRTITLHCPASGIPIPRISWYRDDALIRHNTTHVKLIDQGWKLKIHHARVKDTARYSCKARNIAGESEKFFDVQVLVPPTIDASKLDTKPTVVVNRTLVLNCPASGIPSPDIKWLRNGEPVNINRYSSLQLLAGGRQLRINKAQVSDTASYRCLVANKAGQAHLDFSLQVHVPVNIDKTDLILDPKVIIGRSQILDCPAVGIPIPKIVWYKDNQPLDLRDHPHIKILQDGRQLEILSAEVKDTGHYDCRAINEAGSDNVMYELDVFVPPRIDEESSSSTNPSVIVNRTITINCFVSGIPKPKVEWLRNGRPLDVASTKGRFRIITEGRQLEIAKAEVPDTARYSCIATNEAGVADRDFDLDVLVPPYIDTTNIELNPRVIKGRPVILNCPAQGIPFPNVTWLKERVPVQEDGRIRFLANGRQLEISFTQEIDTARYTCVAVNVAGQAKKDYDLNVLVPPSIDEANLVDNPRVVINRTVLLECPVDGIPPPKVKWMKNGSPLNPLPEHVSLLSEGRQLEFSAAQVSDTSRYTCIATNEAGELQRTFDLEVLVPPSMPNLNGEEKITVIENRTVYIDCPVSGTPTPSILWLKDRSPLLDFPYPRLRELANGRQLEVRDVKVDDGGRYTCMATNVAGQIEKNYKVRVWVPPIIEGSRKPQDLSVIIRQPIRIECHPTGVPEPNITWHKDGEEVNPIEARHIRLMQNGRVLQIMGARVEDAGRYTCSARNDAGQDQKLYTLDVYVPPKVNDSLRITEVPIVINQPLTLSCVATGIPEPTITWVREGEPVSFLANPNLRALDGGRRLQVVNAQLQDIGGYTCVAGNVAGNATKDFIVNVLVPPTIEDGPKEVKATVNTRTLLMCETLGLPDPVVTWEKDGDIIPNNGLRYRMHRAGSLEFSAVKVEDSGTYKCTAKNDAGTESRIVKLDIQVPPTIAHDGPVDLKVRVGEEIVLPCEASGIPRPRIIWQKGTRVLASALGYELLESGSMKIHRAEEGDSGIYICVAQNSAGTALGQVRLVVQEPPVISRGETEYTVIQDRELTLPCRASGTPTPTVSWEKDGRPINPSDFRYRILRSGWLAIPLTTVDHSGSYTCIAKNDAGRASIVIDVVVQVPPNIQKGQRLITVTEGDTALLPCLSKGFPPPKISWIHDGRTMIHNSGKHNMEQHGGLTIRDVQSTDGGSYVCTAVNKAGRDSREVILRVQVPPKFTLLPRDQEVTANGRIELECAADGIPTPVIEWRVNKTHLPSQTSVNGRSRLIIDNAMKRDDGTYMCIAENPAGTRKALAAVRVKVPPRVLIPPGNHAVTLAQRVILSCSVGGDPAPTIIWTKNGRPVDLNHRIQQLANGSLVIYDSTNEDAGQYKCVATNDAGSSEGTAYLTIRSPPEFLIEPRNLVVEQGSTVMMPCVAEGDPKPSIEWRKERVTLSTADRITIMPNNSLLIIATQLADSGIYICLARNNLGSVLVQAKLTVQVHGSWSPWSSWSDCSTSCGQGNKFRTRICDNPEPANGGRPCSGQSKERRSCSSKECPVNGAWSQWTQWEPCSQSCGVGDRTRSRRCDNPPPLYGGRGCEGTALEAAVCNLKPCPMDGNWGSWGPWQPCSETCGDGTQERYRRCDNPRKQHNGRDCVGSDTDRRSCKMHDCEVHGSWSLWAEWTACTLSCGGGSRTRVRRCDNPAPSHRGNFCPGEDKQIDYCNKEDCPVHGNWAVWTDWGDCTVTCGGGQRRRFRTCTDPEPSQNGRPCIGSPQDTSPCNTERCAVDGEWSVWGLWTECTQTCGGGSQRRYRACKHPQFGGDKCLGDATQIRKCNIPPCTAGLPQRAVANVIGNVNNKEFGIAQLTANISRTGQGTRITGNLSDIPGTIGKPTISVFVIPGQYLQHLISILAPVYWTTATEVGEAVNGFTLTQGNFRREVQVEFATGEILKMTHIARGVDENGVLQIDIIVNGDVPMLPPKAKIRVLPYVEDYVQTGPGSIYAYSSRMFHVNGYSLPYAWNHTITYDEEMGRMPYLVQRLRTDDVFVDFDISKELLQYQLTASISKGDPSNRCPVGFFLDQDGPFCKDENECSRMPPCSHYCHNSPGSFSCSCPIGLSLDSDGKTCKDIDECELRIGRCRRRQQCLNTIGSYRCVVKCGRGFRRTAGGLSCQDIDECRERPAQCSQQCLNLIGSYRCACSKGYRLQGRNKCVDINECIQNKPCSHECENLPGSYRCTCPPGFILMGNGICRDIDECTESEHDCQTGQECQNTPGGYQCINNCPNGLELAANGTCVDIDECTTGASQCYYNQRCVNTFQSYRCVCPRGFRSPGPGQPCVDINECLDGPCAFRCRNLLGRYQCICPPGQMLLADKRSCAGLQFLEPGRVLSIGEQSDSASCKQDGTCDLKGRDLVQACPAGYRYVKGKCRDINECERHRRCQHGCQNTQGSYRCTCPQGYRLAANSRTCQDIDECKELQLSCGTDQICFNRRGDYKCIDTPCPPEYIREPRTGHCVLECKEGVECPPGSRYADILEFRTVALPNGIPAFQDLIRLIAYDQFGVHLPRTTFTIIENDKTIPFNIRIQNGKGVVFTLKPLEEQKSYRIKVQAKSYDHRRKNVQYQTTFIIFISVSAYPY